MAEEAAKKVLIIDDEPSLVRLVEQVLTQSGYEVLEATNGREALRLMFERRPDLVILDVVMPQMDGWETCRRIREISDVPIMILTGQRNTEEDIVRGLDFGADEYLLKPVGNRELTARVRAALRRADLPPYQDRRRHAVYSDDYLAVDIADRKVVVGGEQVRLTPREFRLLALLVENAGSVLTHRQVLENVWGWEYMNDVDYVRIYISHLRQKLEAEPNQPRYILTEPGVGYYFQKKVKSDAKIDIK